MGIHPGNDFRNAVEAPAKVVLEIDADLAEYLKSQFADWQSHANDLLRFFMDTSQQKEREFEPGAWEPGEMEEPDRERVQAPAP